MHQSIRYKIRLKFGSVTSVGNKWKPLVGFVFILFIMLNSNFQLYCQKVITLSDPAYIDESIRRIKETDDNNLLFLKFTGPQTYSYLELMSIIESSIILTNSDLQEINSASIVSEQGNMKILAEGFIRLGDHILLHGNAVDTLTMDTQLCLIWLDLELNILQTKFYGSESEQEVFFSYCVNDQGNIVFVGEYPVSSSYQELVIIEIDSTGNFIGMHHTGTFMVFPDVVFFEQEQCYVIGEFNHLYKYDRNFNQIDVFEPVLYDAFFPSGQPLKISDSLYIRTGFRSTATYPFKTDITRVVFNVNAEYSGFEQIIIPEFYDVPAGGNAVSSTDLESFFLGGTSNSTNCPFVNEDTQFALQKFNLEGTIYWEELYETGGCAVMIQVLALQNGGCLMAGQIYDWRNSPVQQRDLFFIKVDDMGIVTGIEEDETSPAKITVYPNPGTNQLNLSVDDEVLKFTMYDFNGRKVLGKMHPGKTINVSKLNPGFYIWWAELHDGTTLWGKWIKQ